MSSFPTLAVLASLANAASRGVTIADTIWFRAGRMRGMFRYDERVRRIVFDDDAWSVPPHQLHDVQDPDAAARALRIAEEELCRQAYEHFVLRRSDGCDIVAVLIYERALQSDDAPASPKGHGTVAEASPARKKRLVVDYLTAERLGLFLRSPLADQDVLVSRYAGPNEGPWSAVHCVWTDSRLIGVERRVNRANLNDKTVPVPTRTSTTAMDGSSNYPVAVPSGTQARLGKLCAAVQAAFNAGSPEAASTADRYGLYFFSSVPMGAAKPGRWILLGANESPVPKLTGAPQSLLRVLPPRPHDGGGRHSRSGASGLSMSPSGFMSFDADESVSWAADGPSLARPATTDPEDYFQPRRSMAATPSVDDGRRRVKPHTSHSTKRPQPLVRRSLPSGAYNTSTGAGHQSRGQLELYKPGDANATFAERIHRREAVDSRRRLEPTLWRAQLQDGGSAGYLTAPPHARTLPPVAARAATPGARITASEDALITRAQELDTVPADPNASSAVRAVSREQCVTSKLLRTTRQGRALTPSSTTFVGTKAFKTTFVDRLIAAMDGDNAGNTSQHHHQSSVSRARGNDADAAPSSPAPFAATSASPSPAKRNRPPPMSPGATKEPAGNSAASPSAGQSQRAEASPAASPGNKGRQQQQQQNASQAASPEASTNGDGSGNNMRQATLRKREELKGRYDPQGIVDTVLDGIYNVYSASLDDPTEVKEIHLLQQPAPVVRQPPSLSLASGGGNAKGTSSTDGSANTADGNSGSDAKKRQKPKPADDDEPPQLASTIDVLLLPMEDFMQLELQAFMKEIGVRVELAESVSAAGLSASGGGAASASTAKKSQPIVYFPRDQAAAAKVRMRMQRMAREVEEYIDSLTIPDVTQIQRDVAESGDGVFHPIVRYSMRVVSATAALTGALKGK